MIQRRERPCLLTPPLCFCATVGHFHFVISVLLLSHGVHCLPPASLAVKPAPPQPGSTGCHPGFASSRFRGRWAVHGVAGLEKAPWPEQTLRWKIPEVEKYLNVPNFKGTPGSVCESSAKDLLCLCIQIKAVIFAYQQESIGVWQCLLYPSLGSGQSNISIRCMRKSPLS